MGPKGWETKEMNSLLKKLHFQENREQRLLALKGSFHFECAFKGEKMKLFGELGKHVKPIEYNVEPTSLKAICIP